METSDEVMAFDKAELAAVFRAFKSMDQESIDQARQVSGALAAYLKDKVTQQANTLYSRKVAGRIAEGSRVKKSSRIGELSFGFAGQRYSGGATTKDLWAGSEFGSNRYKQFPVWSGRFGRGSRGWFIYPTLRKEQPYIVREWENSFQKILGKWD